ncbi:MAG TPA: rRNA maturation RNase YbeY [Candidatus Hydrogenedentes bacterium]|nr:rRNA maturation RNase YbeY [Candidatus Hydrogenedentota bacterium]
MSFHLDVQNISSSKYLYRRDVLARIMRQVCAEEGAKGPLELSVLFCDDPFIRDLNRRYRKRDEPTDVLSFAQAHRPPGAPAVLGDIVISLETVARRCRSDRQAMRQEVRLLFCHGLLHLLGYTHNAAEERETMQLKQVRHLGITKEAAWRTRPRGRP